MASKIFDLEFPSFSKEERTSTTNTIASLKDTLDEAILQAVKKTDMEMIKAFGK
jgi:hypothetical protein